MTPSIEDLQTDYTHFANDAGIEKDTELWEQLKGFANAGFTKTAETFEGCRAEVHDNPTLSRSAA